MYEGCLRRVLMAMLIACTVLSVTACQDTYNRDDSTRNQVGQPDEPGGGEPGAGGDPAMPDMVCDADAAATQETSRTATVRSTDITGNTIDIALSVFTPALDEGECAPVIIKSHGFGGSRLTSLAGVPDSDNATNVATRDAWRNGYFVITYDQRGFGETGGKVHVEDPDFEGQDIKAVLDYAADNLGGHLAHRRGDPVIGALGLSYGGGFQLVGAGVDSRFDAIVPAATWYSLPYSLNPNGVPKTVWIDLLIALGATGSNGQLAPFLYQGFVQSQLGSISDDVVSEIRGNGLDAFCEGLRPSGRGVPQVDTFLVQGVNDTLFNMNETRRNAECLRRAGNDVNVLVQRTGHILPLFQDVMDAFSFDLDSEVTCGNRRFDTSERMLSFLDEKVRGIPARPAIDKTCIVQDDDHGIVTDTIPVGGERYSIPKTSFTTGPVIETVNSVLSGLSRNGDLLPTIADSLGMTVSNLLGTVDNLVKNPSDLGDILTNDVLKLLPPELLIELTAPKREIPLFTAQRDMTLAGVPQADLTLGGPDNAADPIAFVGIGVKRAGQRQFKLLNEQIAPLRGTGEYKQPLVGVSTQLQAGDEVYLFVYGFHYQYFLGFNKIPQPVSISGSVDLPLAGGSG